MAGWLQAAAVIALVGALHVPLGDYMARAFTAPRHWRVERVIYRLGGMDPDTDQPWPHYIRSLLAMSPGSAPPRPTPARCAPPSRRS
jgi:potassium-transporting ATPase potassium-binding subunit